MYFVDDGILVRPNKHEIDENIESFKEPTKTRNHFDIEDCGDITDYLGINFYKFPNGKLKLSQTHLIDQIVKDVGMDKKMELKRIPAPSSHILQRYLSGKKLDNDRFDYRSVIG